MSGILLDGFWFIFDRFKDGVLEAGAGDQCLKRAIEQPLTALRNAGGVSLLRFTPNRHPKPLDPPKTQ